MNTDDPTRPPTERRAADGDAAERRDDDRADRAEPAGLADWLTAARTDAASRVAPAWIEAHLVTRFEEKHAMASLASAQREPPASPPAEARAAMPALRTAAETPRPRRKSPRWAWFGWWLAAPSFTLVAIAVGLVVLAPEHMRPTPGHSVVGGIERPRFIALAPLDDIAADTGPRVVTARIPRAAVAGFGLPVDPARADQPLNAEFLVSARGVVLGIRFLD